MSAVDDLQAKRSRRRWLVAPMARTLVLVAPAIAGAAKRTGTNGPDRIVATQGDDVINGLAGDDTIFAGKGKDRVDGGAGDDRIEGEDNRDVLSGGSGNDLVIDRSGNRDVLRFPDVPLSQARVVKKGRDNLVVITPRGQVEIADGGLDECEDSKNRTSEVEGLIFKGGQQAEIRTGRSLRLVPVQKINTTDCGGDFCIDTSRVACDDYFGFFHFRKD